MPLFRLFRWFFLWLPSTVWCYHPPTNPRNQPKHPTRHSPAIRPHACCDHPTHTHIYHRKCHYSDFLDDFFCDSHLPYGATTHLPIHGNCIWDPRKKFHANCFENGRVIAISLSLPTIIYHSISPPIIISHSISSPTIPYHNISPPIIIYHHRSFLDHWYDAEDLPKKVSGQLDKKWLR